MARFCYAAPPSSTAGEPCPQLSGTPSTGTDFNPPARLITLERHLAQEAQLATASGRLDVPGSTFLPPFPQDVEVIDATEAGRLLGLSGGQVRRLGAELGGRKVGGRWLFDAMAVAAQAVDRKRAA